MLAKKKINYFPGIIAGILFSVTGSSQTLRLPDAISIALKNSLDIQVLKNNVQITETNNNIGVAGGLPVINSTISDNEQVTGVNQKLNTGVIIKRSGAVGNTLNTGLTASILLYNGSRVITTKKRLEELQAQSEEYLNAQIQDVVAAVMTAYYDIIRQESYLKTIDHSIDASQKRLDIVKTQQNVGMANNADLFQSQLDLNSLLQAKQSQQLAIDQSKTALLQLLTLKPDSLINITDTIIVDNSVTLGDILNSLRNNADIIAADKQIRISQLISKETEAQRYPTLSASTSYSYNRSQISAGQLLLNQSNGFSGGLRLSIPIYNGSIYKRQKKVADINIKNAALEKDILIRDYTANAVKTFQAYSNGLQQIETQQQNVVLAGKLLDLVLMRFQLRQATILEVKQAQQSFEDASYTLTNLSFAAKSSEVELKRLANQIKF
ncbi:MAG: TolC family protein [Bacteroidetes bacterium]|nr:TolC family protein [Bacteroidota bacterium]MBS1930317.1 TolC family protein [Bacteroidota bacterium]